MKNTLRFLILALFGVTFAFAQEQKHFCIEEIFDAANNVYSYVLLQTNVQYSGATTRCFDNWYSPSNAGEPTSVVGYFNQNSKLNEDDSTELIIGSEIDFGEYGWSSTSCQPEAGKTRYDFEPLGNVQRTHFFAMKDSVGNPFAIKNLCYVHDYEDGNGENSFGFFNSLTNSSVQDIVFEKPYVFGENMDLYNSSQVYDGVLAGSISNSSIHSVTVKNSKVYGVQAGTIAGSMNNVKVSNVTMNTASVSFYRNVMAGDELWGSYNIGGVAGVAKSSDISQIMISNLSVSESVGRVSQGEGYPDAKGYLGGIVGHMNQGSVSACGVNVGYVYSKTDDASIVSLGYLVGEMDLGASVSTRVVSNYYIGFQDDAVGYPVGSLILSGSAVSFDAVEGKVVGEDTPYMTGNFRSWFTKMRTATDDDKNGCLLQSAMNTPEFVYRLNESGEYWSFGADDVPVLLKNENKPAHKVDFLIKKSFAQSLSIESELTTTYKAETDGDNYVVSAYTDSLGRLRGTWLDYVVNSFPMSLSGSSFVWLHYENSDADAFKLSSASEFSEDMALVLDYEKLRLNYVVESVDGDGNVIYVDVKNLKDTTFFFLDDEYPQSISVLRKGVLLPLAVMKYKDAQGNSVTEPMECSVFWRSSLEKSHKFDKYYMNGIFTQDESSSNQVTILLEKALQFRNQGQLTSKLSFDLSEIPLTLESYGIESSGTVGNVDAVLIDDASAGEKFVLSYLMRVSANAVGKTVKSWKGALCLGCSPDEDFPNAHDYDFYDSGFDMEEVLDDFNAAGGKLAINLNISNYGYFDVNALLEEFVPLLQDENLTWIFDFEPIWESNSYSVSYNYNNVVDGEFADVFLDEKTTVMPASLQYENHLPTLYRADGYCFEGWTLEDGGEAFTSVDESFVKTWEQSFWPGPLTAKWRKDSSCGGDEIILETNGYGNAQLVQYYMDGAYPDSIVHDFKETRTKNELGIKLPNVSGVKFVFTIRAPENYSFITRKFEFKDDSNGSFAAMNISGQKFTYESGDYLRFRSSSIDRYGYAVTFDFGLGEASAPQNAQSLYVASTKGIYDFREEFEIAIDEDFPKVYSTEHFFTDSWCLEGACSGKYDLDMYDSLVAHKTNEVKSTWKQIGPDDDMLTVSVKSEHGDVVLMQKIGNATVSTKLSNNDSLKLYDFGANSPDPKPYYTFLLDVVPEKGYALANSIEVDDGSGVPWTTQPGWYFNVQNRKMELNARFDTATEIKVSLQKNLDSVYVDETSSSWNGKNIAVVYSINNEVLLGLPKFVYTVDSCVLGWASQENAKEEDRLDVTKVWTVGNLVQAYEDTVKTLYAIWGNAEQCLELKENGHERMFNQLELKTAGKTVELRKVKDEGSLSHYFDKNGIMLFPSRGFGEYAFYGDDFDSVQVEYRDYSNEKITEKFAKGAPVNIGFVDDSTIEISLIGDGNGKKPDTPAPAYGFVKQVVLQSGNVARYDFVIDKNVVTSSADVRVILVKEKDQVVDTTVSLMNSTEGKWMSKLLPSGEYELISFVDEGQAEIPSEAFKQHFVVADRLAEGCKDCWHMVSLDNVFYDDIGLDDDAVFYWWNEESNYGDFWQYHRLYGFNAVEMARGYWYNSLEGRGLKLNEPSDNEVPLDKKVYWDLDSVYSGWNLVANTNSYRIDLRESSSFEEGMEFLRWNVETGEYDSTTILEPYEGAWIKVNRPGRFLVPSTPVFVDDKGALQKSRESRTLAKAYGRDDWMLQVMLFDNNGKRDVRNVVGVGANSLTVEEPPEGLGNHVNLSIVDGRKSLAKSVKSASEEMSWNVEVSATSSRPGKLRIDGISSVNSFGYKVFATIDGKTTELHDGEELDVVLTSKAKVVQIQVAESAKTVVSEALGSLRAQSFGTALKVMFDASAALEGAPARVELIDLKGSVVNRSFVRTVCGLNAVSLNAPKRGIYLLRVRVGSQQMVGRVMVR